MATNNEYLAYPKNIPPKDSFYLVSVKPELIMKLGLTPGPPVLIAKYNLVKNEWTAILGLASAGLGNIGDDVIFWRDLPIPI